MINHSSIGSAPRVLGALDPAPSLLRDTFTLYRRSLIRMLHTPAQIYFSLLQPLIWFLLFGQLFSRLTTGFGVLPGNGPNPLTAQFGTSNYSAFFLPAIIVQVLLFGATNAALGIINDDQSGYLNKLRVSPVRRSAVLMGLLLADLTRLSFQVLVLLVLGLLLGIRPAYLELLPLVFVIAALFGLMMGGVGLFIGLATRNSQTTFLIINFLTLPLLFASSAQLPVALLPDWLQVVARYNPVTYAINALRVIIVGLTPQQIEHGQTLWGMLALGLSMLLALALVALAAAVVRFGKHIS